MALTTIVYGQVRGGSGSAGTPLAFNGTFWVQATQLPTGSPGVAQSAWTDGQIIQISTPAVVSVGAFPHVTSKGQCNLATFPGVDPTGNFDSQAGIAAAVAYAEANALTLFVPYGDYRVSRDTIVSGALVIEGETPLTVAGNLQPSIRAADTFLPGVNTAWMGPAFRVTPGSCAKPVQYVHSGNFYRALINGSASNGNLPLMFLSESPFSNLNGLSAFTIEYLIKITAGTIPSPSYFPYVGGGKSTHSPLTSALNVLFNGTGPFGMTVTLTVAGGSVTCSTGATAFALNTDYAIAITWDGTTLKLFAGAPGGAPTITASNTGGTGAVVQHWWEDFIMGGSATSGDWPLNIFNGGPGMQWGNFRLSSTAHTITTMPSTEFLYASDVLSDTLMLVSFAPANLSDLTGVLAITHSPLTFGVNLSGQGSGLLMWRNIFFNGTEAGGGATFKNINFRTIEAIQAECTNQVNDENCNFNCQKGITRVNNCFYWHSTNATYQTGHFNTGNVSHCWGAAAITASGIALVDNPNFGSQDSSNVGLIFSGSPGCLIKNLIINTINGYCGLILRGGGGAQSDFLLHNVGLGSEGGVGGVIDTVAIFDSLQNLVWQGGGLFPLTNVGSGYSLLIDGGAHYRMCIDLAAGPGNVTSHLGSPAGAAPVYPVILDSAYQGQGIENALAWSDGSIDVVVTTLESNGRTVWNAVNNGSITCQWFTSANGSGIPIAQGAGGGPTGPDFTCRTIVITDTGAHLTGLTAVVAPTKAAGHRRRILNSTLQSITFGAAAGATVTIAAGKTAEVESNGSGWERVTPDT